MSLVGETLADWLPHVVLPWQRIVSTSRQVWSEIERKFPAVYL